MTVGSGNPYHKKAELYEFGTGAWLEVDDYPVNDETSVYNYDMVYISETSSYYVIGGQYKEKLVEKLGPHLKLASSQMAFGLMGDNSSQCA